MRVIPSFRRLYNQVIAALASSAVGSGADMVANAVRRVENIAEMQALTGLRDGARITVTGYYTTAVSMTPDGGGGEFIYRATSAATHNGGTVFTATGMGAGRFHRVHARGVYPVEWFGAKVDDATIDTAAVVAAIAHAGAVASGAQGARVTFPTGSCLIDSTITLPNRVALHGANGRGSIIKAAAGFVGTAMVNAVNGTSSMFGSRLVDLWLNGQNNVADIIHAQAWQETCGLERVVLQNFTAYGLRITDGYGGAAFLPLRDIEIFSDHATAQAGIFVDTISLVGGFVLSVDGATIAGSAANPLPDGILLENDSLVCRGLHVENNTHAVRAQGVGALSVDSITGSQTATVNLVTLDATFTGRVNARNLIGNGATGNLINDLATGRSIPASEGMLPEFTYPESGFSAYVSAQIPNVTGNGAEYTIVFDTEVYDRRSEYSVANGVFTAQRSGKYLFTGAVKVTPTAAITTFVLKLVTSNRTYHAFRGDTDSLRDGSGGVTLNFSFIADLDATDTARVNVIGTGLASNDADVEANETYFMGQWLGR